MKHLPTLLLLSALVSLATSVCADDNAKQPKLSNKGWNETTDFATIRRAYASEPDYNAYAYQLVEKTLITTAMKEWDTGDKAKALTMLLEATETCPLSIELNRRIADGCAVLLSNIKDPETKQVLSKIEKRFRTIAEGILKSIVASGDGKTPKTAYKVISIPEEYMTLWYLGLNPKGQILDHIENISCDIMTVENADTGEKSTVYFDVTIFHDKPPTDSPATNPDKT